MPEEPSQNVGAMPAVSRQLAGLDPAAGAGRWSDAGEPRRGCGCDGRERAHVRERACPRARARACRRAPRSTLPRRSLQPLPLDSGSALAADASHAAPAMGGAFNYFNRILREGVFVLKIPRILKTPSHVEVQSGSCQRAVRVGKSHVLPPGGVFFLGVWSIFFLFPMNFFPHPIHYHFC